MPLVIGYLPVLGLGWLADESFHQVMAALCLVLAAVAFVPGWRIHGSLVPVTVGVTGVVLLCFAAYGLEGCCPSCNDASSMSPNPPSCADESCPHCLVEGQSTIDASVQSSEASHWWTPMITPLGGLFLVVGHLVNHRKSCKCTGNACCLAQASQ